MPKKGIKSFMKLIVFKIEHHQQVGIMMRELIEEVQLISKDQTEKA